MTSFSNRSSPNYGVQANGAIHGNVTINGATPESAEEKLLRAKRLLASHVPRAAAELIEDLHARGERTTESSFYHVLALISGKPIHEFRWEQIAATIAAAPPHGDEFDAGTRFVDHLLRFNVYPTEAIGNAQPVEPVIALSALADEVHDLISAHCAVLLSGLETAALDKQLTELRLMREGSRESDNLRSERARRVPLFFLHDPAAPRLTHAAVPAQGIRELAGAGGSGLVLVLGLSSLVQTAAPNSFHAWFVLLFGLVGAMLTVAALVVARAESERHLVRLRRFEPLSHLGMTAASRTDSSRSDEQRVFAQAVARLYATVFVAVSPEDGQSRANWLRQTAGIQHTLADETTVTYINDDAVVRQPGRLIWRMVHEAEDLLDAWRSDHFFDYRQRRRRTITRVGRVLMAGIGGWISLWSLNWLDSGRSLLGAALVAASVWLSWNTWLPWAFRVAGARRLQDVYDSGWSNQEAHYHSVLNLLRDRPSDQEMAAWLEEDMRYVLAHAVWVHQLVLQDLHWNVVLNEGAPNSMVARYDGRPARFSAYTVKVFLLTRVGSRHIDVHLDFATGLLGQEVRGNFRYESISMVLVKEMARAQRSDDDSNSDRDVATEPRNSQQWTTTTLSPNPPNVVMVGKKLIVQLNNTTNLEVTASANLLRGQAESHFDHGERELIRLQEEASGIDTATQILEGVAADGALWFDRARRDSYRTFLKAFHPAMQVLENPAYEGSVVDVRALESGEIDLTVEQPDATVDANQATPSSESLVEAEIINETIDRPVQPEESNLTNRFHNENSPNTGVQSAGDINGDVSVTRSGEATSNTQHSTSDVLREIRQLRSLVDEAMRQGAAAGTGADIAQDTAARAEQEAEKPHPDLSALRKWIKIIQVSMDDVAGISQATLKILQMIGQP